jgi:prophage regulatory protein
MNEEAKPPPAMEVATWLAGAKLLRLPAVCLRVGLQRTAVYALISAGKFPPPVKVGGASAWVDVEITKWIEGLVASRDSTPSGGAGRRIARRRDSHAL